MLCKASQPAGPIGLKFFVDTHGWSGVLQNKKNRNNFFQNNFFFLFFKFFLLATPGHSASVLYN